jgi:hypothetical protein
MRWESAGSPPGIAGFEEGALQFVWKAGEDFIFSPAIADNRWEARAVFLVASRKDDEIF